MKCTHNRKKFDIDACYECYGEPDSPEISECPECYGKKEVLSECGKCLKKCSYCKGSGVKKWSYNSRLFLDSVDKACSELGDLIGENILNLLKEKG
jgi:hypothetical protein